MIMLATVGAVVAVLLAMPPGPRRPPPSTVSGVDASSLRWMAPPVVLASLLLVGPFVAVALVVGLVVGLGGRALWQLRRRRRQAVHTADRVLETCELLAAEVASGQPPVHALSRAAEAWPTLGPAAEAGALGGDLPQTLRELSARPGASELRLVGAAWEVAHRSGSGLADALERVAASVRADRATRRVVEGELASARSTARLVAALPLLVLLLGVGADTSPWTFLLTHPIGWACLVGGLGLGLLGLWWIERIAAAVVG